jgi:hypothetical protein
MPKHHDGSAMGQVSPSKNDLPDVRFGSAGIHTVNSPPNIQARGLHILQKGTTATSVTIQDNTWQEAMSPSPTAMGHRMV